MLETHLQVGALNGINFGTLMETKICLSDPQCVSQTITLRA